MYLTRAVGRCSGRYLASYRACSTNEHEFNFKPQFSKEEQQKILHILNQANADELSKFDVTRGRIKSLEHWRLKNGPFRSLSEILEVEGLGEKVLERLCNSIVLNKTSEPEAKQSVNRKQHVLPMMDPELLNKVRSIVGIHISATGVSWTKLLVDNNEVQVWNFQDFSYLPKKMLPTETYELAVQILRQLPAADVYIMEAAPSMSLQNQQSTKAIPTYTQNLELSSMLLALINSSPKHGMVIKADDEFVPSGHNKVYYLRTYLPARLFKTLVGNERVSSGAIMEKLLNQSSELPCRPITTAANIKETFSSHSAVHKDLLGQSLMLVVTFANLCIFQTAQSLQIINRSRRKT